MKSTPSAYFNQLNLYCTTLSCKTFGYNFQTTLDYIHLACCEIKGNLKKKSNLNTLTGKLSLTASTGAWKGHENWCFHRVFSTTLSRYCSWFVWRLGRIWLMISGGWGLVACGGCDWSWPWELVLLPDICVASRPSPMVAGLSTGTGPSSGGGKGGATEHLSFSFEPGAASAGRAPLIPLHSSLGSLLGDTTERFMTTAQGVSIKSNQ